MSKQIQDIIAKRGPGDLAKLLAPAIRGKCGSLYRLRSSP